MSAPTPPILNFYDVISKGKKVKRKQYPNYDTYKLSVPNRFMLVGSGGSGKTNILLNLILGVGAWTKIVMLVKMPDEPLYQYLIDEIRKVEAKLKVDILTVSDTLDDLPDVDSFDSRENTLLIIDDMLGESAKDLAKVSHFWVRGRKRSVSCAFLTQSYFGTPKLIRQNTDVCIFKKLTLRDLKMVLKEYSLDKTVDELMAMYRSCNPSSITDFFMIDMSPGQAPELMYRHNFSPIDC
jgi:hypothetical protein